jgi:sulfite exporter TauE/SafE
MPTHPIAEILPAWLATVDPLVAVPFALFLFGLVGGFAHCAGMCGPFVVAQLAQRLDGTPVAGFSALARLRAGVLPFYHLGRATTYTVLGAAASGLTGLATLLLEGRSVVSVGLAVAAVFFLVVSLGFWRPQSVWFGGLISRVTASATKSLHAATGGYMTGVLLGLLPCHLVYAALAASTVLADPLGGALSMLAFAAGTSAGLVAVGCFGMLAGHHFRGTARRLLPIAGLANSVVLAALSVRVAVGG